MKATLHSAEMLSDQFPLMGQLAGDLAVFLRVDVEQGGNDDKHQAFHEDEETRNKNSVFSVSV
jgi:hypothetical protein